MKSRLGFVSNSSSSSFLIAVKCPYDKKDALVKRRLKEMVYQNHLIIRDCDDDTKSTVRENAWIRPFLMDEDCYEEYRWFRAPISILDYFGFETEDEVLKDCDCQEGRVEKKALELSKDGWIVSMGRMRDGGEGGSDESSFIRSHMSSFEIRKPDFVMSFGEEE